MDDLFGRTIRYLRLSLTRACNMRCAYCRPGLLARGEVNVLTTAEITALVDHLAQRHGLRKVRLTGGEPTTRADLLDVVAALSAIEPLRELTMTTNGLTLERQATALADAGLTRVNISLDSLDPRKFSAMTGVNGLDRVVRGIDAALEAGLTPVKLNTVVMRGENDQELPDLVRFAAGRGCEIRFIELMPMGPLAAQWRQRYINAAQMRHGLDPHVKDCQALPRGADSAARYRAVIDGRAVTIGFITPMSCNFCAQCDRLRIAADGAVHPCLMDRPNGSLIDALRPGFDAPAIDRILGEALRGKAAEHPAVGVTVMTHIGG